MDINTIEKEIEELKKQKEENNKKIALFNERIYIMRVSKADFTRETIIANGMIGYLLLVITFFCLNNVGINFIQSSLDAFCFPIIITGGSFLVGTITKKILFKKYRYNDKLKEFSNAKTEVEKKENELNNTIKRNKMIAKNKILNLVINNLKYKQDILREVSNEYNLTNKNSIKKKDELTEKISKLSNELEFKREKLDMLIHQKNIYEKFMHLDNAIYKIFKLIIIPLGIGYLSSFFILIASVICTNFHIVLTDNFFLINQANKILWFLIGFSSSLIIKLTQYKNDRKVLNNIIKNSKNISTIKNEKELTEVNELIDSYIEEIAVDTVKLKELELSLKNADMNEELTNTKSRAISPITDIETKNIPRTRKLTND